MGRLNIVGRGYVLIRRDRKVSAVCSLKDVMALQRRFGGRVVNVKGHVYRYAQGGTIRVLLDPSAVLDEDAA